MPAPPIPLTLYHDKWVYANPPGKFATNEFQNITEATFREFAGDTEYLASRGDNQVLSLHKRVSFDSPAHPFYTPGKATLSDLLTKPWLFCLGTQIVQLFPRVTYVVEFDGRAQPELWVRSEATTDSDFIGGKLLPLDSPEAITANIPVWSANFNPNGTPPGYPLGFVIRATFNAIEGFHKALQPGQLPAPTSAAGDAFWRPIAGPQPSVGLITLTRQQAVYAQRDGEVQPGRRYRLLGGAGQGRDVLVDGTDPENFAPEGLLVIPARQSGSQTIPAEFIPARVVPRFSYAEPLAYEVITRTDLVNRLDDAAGQLVGLDPRKVYAIPVSASTFVYCRFATPTSRSCETATRNDVGGIWRFNLDTGQLTNLIAEATVRLSSAAYLTNTLGQLVGFATTPLALQYANQESMASNGPDAEYGPTVWLTTLATQPLSTNLPTIFVNLRSETPDAQSVPLAAGVGLQVRSTNRVNFTGAGKLVWCFNGSPRLENGSAVNLEILATNPAGKIYTLNNFPAQNVLNPGEVPCVLRLLGTTTLPAVLPAGITIDDRRVLTRDGSGYVKTVNGQLPDAAGNVTVAGSAGSYAAGELAPGSPAGTLLEQLQWLATRSSGGGGGSTAPSITGAAPNSAATGATVMLYGANLSNPTSFTLGGTAITAYAVNQASTAISFTVPPGASTGFISITTANGTATSTGVFTVTTAGRLFADSVLERDNTTGNVQDTISQLAGRSVVTVFSVCDKDPSAEGLHMLAGLLSPDGATMTDIAYFGSAFYANTPYPSRHGLSYNTYTSATYTVDQAADALANQALALVETTLFNGTTPGAGELGEIRVNGVAQTLLKFNPGMQADRAFNGVFVTGGGRDASYDWPGYVKNFLFFGNLSDTRRAEIRAVLRQQFPALPQ